MTNPWTEPNQEAIDNYMSFVQQYVPLTNGMSFGQTLNSNPPVPETLPVPPAAPQPQPQPQPPQSTFQPKPGSEYFLNSAHAAMFEQKRTQRIHHNTANRLGPTWTEMDELDLLNHLHIQWFDEPWPGTNGSSWVENVPPLPENEPLLPTRSFPPFKIDYQTYPEIKLRLLNTVIAINGVPYYVKRIREHNGEFFLLVLGNTDKEYSVRYSSITDLRSPPPMYLTTNSTGWFCRYPARVYQQGVTRSNAHIRTIDGKSLLYNLDPLSFIRAIHRRQNKAWHTSYNDLMASGELSSARLTDNIAVVGKNKILCYRGRPLGKIENTTVHVEDEDDLQQQWIEKEVNSAGLELAA